MRTIPTYLIALVSFSIIYNKFDVDFLKYILLTQNFYSNNLNQDYFFVAWSLAIEEYFYLIFPIFIIFFRKFNFTTICLFFIFILFVLKIFTTLFMNIDFENYRINTFLRLDAIVFGILIRIFLEKIKKIVIALLILLSFWYLYNINLKEFNKFDLFIFVYFLQFFSCLIIIILLILNNFISNPFTDKIFHVIAYQTYSIYLFHMLFIYILEHKSLNNINNIYFYVLIISLFSYIIYNYFEKPINNLRPKI